MSDTISHPPIASADQWRKQRLQLLEEEKAVTKHYDQVAAKRRQLPMVPVTKSYQFEGPKGKVSLLDLFEGKKQLIVYHFMFDPEEENGCPGCTGFVDSLGDLSLLQARNTHFVLISRAPFAKLDRYRQKHGWDRPWYSSYGTEFNYDFHATLDPKVCPVEYNYRSADELAKTQSPSQLEGEAHALSVFFRIDDKVFQTYQCFARGVESLTDSYSLLDVTPYGRQEDWEESPAGFPQKPTYGG